MLRLPFGKHKGELLEDIPSDYLTWLLENVEDLREELKMEAENQLAMQRGEGVVRRTRDSL